jgi:Actinobacteria/chloroflexi VLRF1 release factor
MTTREVLVLPERVGRWVGNFVTRHGETELGVAGGQLTGRAEDGSTFEARPPFAHVYAGPADPIAFARACTPPARWGVLLVRKGGLAIARLAGPRIVESKVGQRHVQGRTKAGGQSQQRFSRRRDNQARAAFDAAAGHAHRVLNGPLTALVCGGDRTAVELVLGDARLRHLTPLRVEPWLAVPDPRRSVLERAVVEGSSVAVTVTDPT